jgi:hypothetical protein
MKAALRDTLPAAVAASELSLMRLIYSDETGTGSATDDPLMVVAAVVVHGDEQWGLIETAVNAILRELVPPRKWLTYEFKAAKLFKDRHRGDNAAILQRLLEILPSVGLPVAYGALLRAAVLPQIVEMFTIISGDAERAAEAASWLPKFTQNLAFLVCATFVERVFCAGFPTERGLWIADTNRVTAAMRASLREYQRLVTADVELPLPGLAHIIDTVYFGDSRYSLGIQLADACNFVIKEHLLGNAEVEPLYGIIAPLLIGHAPSIVAV